MPLVVRPAGAGHEAASEFPTSLEWNCNVRGGPTCANWASGQDNRKIILFQSYNCEISEAGGKIQWWLANAERANAYEPAA